MTLRRTWLLTLLVCSALHLFAADDPAGETPPAATNKPAITEEIRLHGDDKADAILTMGKVENSVILFGYNQLPNYFLDDPSEPGLAWCIEPNYTTQGRRTLEAYLQFLLRSGDQRTVVRPFMCQIDAETGLPTWTEITGGQIVSLNVHDGLPDCGMTGKQVLVAYRGGVTINGTLRNGGPPWKMLGVTTNAVVLEIAGKRVRIPTLP